VESVTENPFAPLLESKGRVLLDGGLATALEEAGHVLDTKLWSARLLEDDPAAIRDVHLAYLGAGADCITTATYQASFPGFMAAGISEQQGERLFRRASELALEALEHGADRLPEGEGRDRDASGRRPLVAGSVGPYGAWLADGSEYDGRYGIDADALERFHARRFHVLADSGVDLLACETLPSALEVEVLLGLLDRHAPTWAWISVSCCDDRHLWDGTPIERVAEACRGRARVAAVGVNCTDPAHLPELVARVVAVTDLPVIAYPNSGETYDAGTRSWTGDHSGWLEGVHGALLAGARIVGGCCRIGPEQIAQLREALDREDWSRVAESQDRRTG
jgi:homocysteine S-methyltransferase